MADLQDLNGAGAAALPCDHAIFTSLPSRVGEGYRLVAWSMGARAEERIELTRRAPSHGSLAGEDVEAVMQIKLQSTGRTAWGFTRVAGTEHTRRGGGRVWTDFVLVSSEAAAREGLHPSEIRAALSDLPPQKQPLGTTQLPPLAVARRGSGEPVLDATRWSRAAAVAALLVDARACVIAVGASSAEVFDDAMRMIPASLRASIVAGAGLRFSSVRGVRATVTDKLDQETNRATRGQGVTCIDMQASAPPVSGALAPWISVMLRWWNEGRSAEAIQLADRLSGERSLFDILHVAKTCEAIDRREQRPEALDALLMRRSAA